MNIRKRKFGGGKHSYNNETNKKNNRINKQKKDYDISANDIVKVVKEDDSNDELVLLKKRNYTKAELEEMIRVIKNDRLDEEKRKEQAKWEQKKGKRLKEKKSNKRKHEKKKRTTFKSIILTFIEIILLGIIIYSGYYIITWYKDNKENNQIKDDISSAVTQNITETQKSNKLDAKNYDIDFDKLKQINPDTIGWIKVNNTEIEYSVVKANDNNFYLDRSFNKNYNGAGWVFADYRNKFNGTDKNIIVYGHNRKDGSMFGTLKDALKPEWYTNEDNKNIVFITEDGKANYEVFSVYMIATEDYYITTEFKPNEFGKFVQKLKNRSTYDFGVEVNENDSILTLSTCAGNDYRTVLHARKSQTKIKN